MSVAMWAMDPRSEKPTVSDLLTADPLDIGCAATFEIISQYVELELAGRHARSRFPGAASHLHACAGCRTDSISANGWKA